VKAFLLAAGEGTRLRPLTFHTPKCLVSICGKPLIEYWFDLLKYYGVEEVLINTSYLAKKVRDYINSNSGEIKVRLKYEKNLIGSGGTIKRNWDFVKDEEYFFILYADNLTNADLGKMVEFHKKSKKDFTLAVFRVPNPKECGIIELDENLSVVSFQEKPENPVSDLAFAGMMLSNQNLINYFPDKTEFDLGYDVLPRIVGAASGYMLEDYLLDIGTHDKLIQAERDIKNNILCIKHNVDSKK